MFDVLEAGLACLSLALWAMLVMERHKHEAEIARLMRHIDALERAVVEVKESQP